MNSMVYIVNWHCTVVLYQERTKDLYQVCSTKLLVVPDKREIIGLYVYVAFGMIEAYHSVLILHWISWQGSPLPLPLDEDMATLMELGLGTEATIIVDEEN